MTDPVARAAAIAAQVRAKESSLVDEIAALDPAWGSLVNNLRRDLPGKFQSWWVGLDGREIRSAAPMREGTWVNVSPRTNNQ